MTNQIYLITNTSTNKKYVGLTTKGASERFKEHIYQHRKHGSCTALYSAMRKYGSDKFSVQVIEDCSGLSELNDREVYWIKKLNTLSPNGYNLTTGGDAGKMSDETKRKASELRIGIPLTEKNKKGLKKAWSDPDRREARCAVIKEAMNRPEVRAEISRRQKGVKKSAHHIASIRESRGTKVRCIETNVDYDTIVDAVSWVRSLGKYKKANHSKICRALKRSDYTAYGYHWELIK